jgi:hypothetical protein
MFYKRLNFNRQKETMYSFIKREIYAPKIKETFWIIATNKNAKKIDDKLLSQAK